MTQTQQSVRIVRQRLKAAGGAPAWKIAGNFGSLELWLVAGTPHLVHGLPADGGVEVYQPLAARDFEELLSRLPAELLEYTG